MLKLQSLYIHIPFCLHKCVYCAFCSGLSPDSKIMDQYTDMLCREISLQANSQSPVKQLDTVYLGGGTPSLLSPVQLEKIINTVHDTFPLSPEAEVTLESNPEDVTPELAHTWHSLGLNRISLGLQSMEDDILKLLERRNSRATNLKVVDTLLKAGFDNISGDIILNIPGMSLDKSLNPMLNLGLTHISAYTLSIEEGAALYRMEAEGSWHPLSEQEAMDQYWQTVDRMQEVGFAQYETSNYAREERFQSRHNLNYWDYGLYYGAGLGASGTWLNDGKLVRYRNTEDMDLYLPSLEKQQLPVIDEEALDRVTQIREYLMLNLRKTQGVSVLTFQATFDTDLFVILPEDRLQSMKEFLEWDDTRIKLSKKGVELANPVTAQLWDLLQC